MKSGENVLLNANKTYNVHGITVGLNIFDNEEFVLPNVQYILELKQNLLYIIIFVDLGYYTINTGY